MRRYLIVVLALGLCACSSPLRRSSSSGYADRDDGVSSAASGMSGRESQKIAAELGYRPTGPLSADQWESVAKRRRVRDLENRLESRKEKEQYSKVLPWLNGDDEKIELLSIPGLEGRQAWINEKGLWKRARSLAPEVKETIDMGDISLGMVQEHVRKAWGEPQQVEVSGNPIYKNERWRYMKHISTPDGYRQESRTVYFEGGRVVGWETE